MNQIRLASDPANAHKPAIGWARDARRGHAGGVNTLNGASSVRIHLIKVRSSIAILQERPEKPTTAVGYQGVSDLITRQLQPNDSGFAGVKKFYDPCVLSWLEDE
jgi:hypothetical protein